MHPVDANQAQPSSETEPHSEYGRRQTQAESDLRNLAKRDSLYSRSRVVVFFLGLFVAWQAYHSNITPWWLLLPVVCFAALVRKHDAVAADRSNAERRRDYYLESLRRLNDDWLETSPTGERYVDPAHLFSADLDLFGPGSLFHLICRARSRSGQDRLADWLCHPAEHDEVLARQKAVATLRGQVDLRESLAVLDAEEQERFEAQSLVDWTNQPRQVISRKVRLTAVFLSGLALLTGFLAAFTPVGLSPFVLVLMIVLCFHFAFRQEIAAVLAQLDDAESGLRILSRVLAIFESRQFGDPWLDRITERVSVEGLPPSDQIARLAGDVGLLNQSVHNQFFIPFGLIFCLPIHLVDRIEIWRATVGGRLADWLSAAGDFEAAMSLGGLAYERPDFPFPSLDNSSPVFVATGVGHPLLKSVDRVCNNVELNSEQRMLMVSGSNMSGKSTLLRTVGINSVLALCGAPVCADALTVSRLQVGTAMRVSDSLQQGSSLFFAVLNRLKRVVDATQGSIPVLFLLDEILQGTNSHDRRIGAEAVIRSLLDGTSIGMVTTHDLALTSISESISSITNVHFADQIDDGEMKFDYCLRSGTVDKSNAIELMRLVGLDVDRRVAIRDETADRPRSIGQ